MNTYIVQNIADMAAASAALQSEFCTVMGNLMIIKDDQPREIVNGVTAALRRIQWSIDSIYQYNLPASNATVLYLQTTVDTVATKQLTNIQKQTVVEGDLCFVLATSVLSGELSSYLYKSLPASTGPLYFQIGAASNTESTIYTPFATATAYAVFGRAAAMAVIETVQAARGARQMTAIALVQNGYV